MHLRTNQSGLAPQLGSISDLRHSLPRPYWVACRRSQTISGWLRQKHLGFHQQCLRALEVFFYLPVGWRIFMGERRSLYHLISFSRFGVSWQGLPKTSTSLCCGIDQDIFSSWRVVYKVCAVPELSRRRSASSVPITRLANGKTWYSRRFLLGIHLGRQRGLFSAES